MTKSSESQAAPRWLIPLVILAVPLILALALIVVVLWLVAGVCLHVAVSCWWLPRGRDILLVYSESPVWQDYVESEILPIVRSRAVVLNLSRRKQWRSGLATATFNYFGGGREFNPLAVVFRPLRRARVFRFWQPFRDWKHGHPEPLSQMQADLFTVIGVREGG